MSDADSDTWRAKVFKNITKQEKRRLLKEAKKLRNTAKKHYEHAGHMFEAIGMRKHAASCFYTARAYDKAAEIFEALKQYGQAAECLMMTGQLTRAAQLYEEAKLITKAIECYETSQAWEQLLHCLHRNAEFFKAEERQALVNKYVPVALNSLYRLYTSGEDEEDGEDNKGKLQEMKIKMKYKQEAVIAEEDEVSSDSEQEEAKEEEEEQVSPDDIEVGVSTVNN